MGYAMTALRIAPDRDKPARCPVCLAHVYPWAGIDVGEFRVCGIYSPLDGPSRDTCLNTWMNAPEWMRIRLRVAHDEAEANAP
jgi:hypothetical protein